MISQFMLYISVQASDQNTGDWRKCYIHVYRDKHKQENAHSSPMALETWIQSQVESYQRQGSKIKWINPGKEVAPFPKPWCSSYRKGSFRISLD